jgi:hypothetical protein
MIFKKNKNLYALRLFKDEYIIKTLTEFAEKEKIAHAGFMGLGAALEVELGVYDLKTKQYSFRKIDSPVEIINITGNISLLDGKPFIHAHISVSDQLFRVFGGHLKEAVVGATCEISLVNYGVGISRVYDENIGLNLLDI